MRTNLNCCPKNEFEKPLKKIVHLSNTCSVQIKSSILNHTHQNKTATCVNNTDTYIVYTLRTCGAPRGLVVKMLCCGSGIIILRTRVLSDKLCIHAPGSRVN